MQDISVERILARAVRAAYDLKVAPEVSVPEARFGDYSSNIAFRVAPELGINPREAATAIVARLNNPALAKAEVAGAGFINLTMSEEYWRRRWAALGADFFKNNLGKGKKVQVEFISANPTGPLTLGNARGGFVGDVLARVLAVSGYDVVREYYFNDAGGQIDKLLESVKAAAGLIEVENRQYQGEYIDELAKELKNEITTKTDEKLKQILTQTIFKRYIKPAVDSMGIRFDEWYNESELINGGEFAAAQALLQKKGLLFERDGAVWLKTAAGGDPREERVFIKSNGEPAYFAPDVAYHINIFAKRGFDLAIKVLGADHVAQFPSVRAPITVLYPNKRLEAVIVQWVRLVKDGREIKISKRSGSFVSVDELIAETGADIARFFMIMRSNDTHMDFDLNVAKQQSQQNPLWYIQYAHVRAGAIMAQAQEQGLTPSKAAPAALTAPERALIRHLDQLPGIVARIASTYEVHKLAYWGIESAKLFHDYYETGRIIDLPQEEAAPKLYLVRQFQTVLAAYLELLGIKPRQRM